MSENKTVKHVSDKTRRSVIWRWFTAVSLNGNVENMMGTGFGYSMIPAMKELYPNDPEKRKAGLKRAYSFYNTEPEIGAVIHGVAVAMEEDLAAGELNDNGDSIVAMKSALMGPLAGIGDALMQGVIIPIILAVCIDMTRNGMVFGPVLYGIIMYAIMIGIMLGLYNTGYKKGSEAIMKFITDGTIDKLMTAAGIMGCTVMGALIAKYVNINCGLAFNIGGSQFVVQTALFDVIMPKILPLGLTMLCLWMFRKGLTSLKVILILIAACIVTGLLNIFTANDMSTVAEATSAIVTSLSVMM